jgi:hypothetical protein
MKRIYGMTSTGRSSYSRNAPITYIRNARRFPAMMIRAGYWS